MLTLYLSFKIKLSGFSFYKIISPAKWNILLLLSIIQEVSVSKMDPEAHSGVSPAPRQEELHSLREPPTLAADTATSWVPSSHLHLGPQAQGSCSPGRKLRGVCVTTQPGYSVSDGLVLFRKQSWPLMPILILQEGRAPVWDAPCWHGAHPRASRCPGHCGTPRCEVGGLHTSPSYKLWSLSFLFYQQNQFLN